MEKFTEKCDFCGCEVTDTIDNYSNYSRTVFYEKLCVFTAYFYCPDCIKQFKIKTDSLNEKRYYISKL